MGNNDLNDAEKSQLLTVLYLNRVNVPGLNHLLVRVAESVEDQSIKLSTVLTLVRYLALLGDFKEAERITCEYLSGFQKVAARIAIGTHLNPHDGLRWLREAEAAIDGTIDTDQQQGLLQELACGYLELGLSDKARGTANRIELPGERVFTLRRLSELLWERGRGEEASAVLADAYAQASRADLAERASAFDDVARVLIRMGKSSEALDALDQAVRFAEYSNDSSGLLASICEELIAIGKVQNARDVARNIANEAKRQRVLSLCADVDGGPVTIS